MKTQTASTKESTFSSPDLGERALYRRAVEAAIWGMPIVSVDAMRQAFLRDAGGKYNDIAYFSKKADWKFQITTPNASSYYVYIPIYLKDGPLVVEIPPAVGAGLFGNMNDAWQAPMADVGPTGEDSGKGGKYLLLPPGSKESVPTGYIPLPFETYNGYSFLRAIPATSSAEDVAKALDLVKKVRIYKLSEAANPPQQRYIDIAGKKFDGIAVFDDSFYDSLARMVDEEPTKERDLVALGGLRSIGIEKGKPFKPDAATRKILSSAVVEARNGFIQSTMALPAFWPGLLWSIPGTTTGPETAYTFEKDGCLDIDARGQLFFLGCAPAKKHGSATFYLAAMRDATGAPLDGGNNYRLNIPPNVPVNQFWATTVYDFETAAFYRDAPRVELNSYDQNMAKNPDGSVDVFFSPAAPAGKESNWIYTGTGKPWLALFRFYGPEKAVFEKTWKLPDLEKVS